MIRSIPLRGFDQVRFEETNAVMFTIKNRRQVSALDQYVDQQKPISAHHVFTIISWLQQMAGLAVDAMKGHGTQFIMESVPVSIEKCDTSGQLKVTWIKADGSPGGTAMFDTVFMAIGDKVILL